MSAKDGNSCFVRRDLRTVNDKIRRVVEAGGLMWTVTRDFAFEAAHALPHLPDGHKCRQLHGHSYRVRVEAHGGLDERGFVVDYAEIKSAVAPLIARLDHQNLNDLFDFPTTSEHLAAWLYREAKKTLPQLSRVVLHETTGTSVIYEE
jgi:6-pyruvoyltetrahydropterin/6-carboxytetrahydropterin synthase